MVFASCTENYIEEPSITPPTDSQRDAYPLFVGNQWAYADSNFTLSPPTYSLDIETISEYTSDSWWVLSSSENVQVPTFLKSRHDTIFSRTPRIGLPDPRIEYVPSPAPGDTIRFSRQTNSNSGPLAPVKVYVLDHPVVTPAGIFDSCVVYDTYFFVERERVLIYLKPGIGPVTVEVWWPLTPEPSLAERRLLVYYRLLRTAGS
jgi:hypothetical protein